MVNSLGGGGLEIAPPPSGARVNWFSWHAIQWLSCNIPALSATVLFYRLSIPMSKSESHPDYGRTKLD